MMAAAHGFREIRHVGELAAGRGTPEVRRKVVQLAGGGCIAAGGGSLSGALQVGGDLLRNLCELGRVRLLKLLERVHQLGERGKLATIRLSSGRRRAEAAGAGWGRAAGQADTLDSCAENRL